MKRILLAIAALLALAVPALAQEWVVGRVRGTAEIQVGWSWVPLERGRVVEPRQKLRTGSDGRIGLMRGSETIELEANTEISLRDAGAELKTSVIQARGVVSVDVERRNVQHFSVQTPYLAAVVKGTKFTVVVDGHSARVNVDRGVVQVQDTGNDLVTDIRRGQEAVVSEAAPLNVTGGPAAAVFTFEGVQVVPGTTEPVADVTEERDAPGGAGSAVPNSDVANPGNGNGGGNGPGNSGGNGNGPGSSGGNGNGPGNSGGNGNGGGSGPGHSGGNGNGNGHGGGSGPGNSGGNGNGHGNGGGSGPGNSGGNGNGNGGGSGPGNPGGNGNGNGNGGGSGPGNAGGGNGPGNSGGGNGGPGNSGGNGNGGGNGHGGGHGPAGDGPGNSGGNGDGPGNSGGGNGGGSGNGNGRG